MSAIEAMVRLLAGVLTGVWRHTSRWYHTETATLITSDGTASPVLKSITVWASAAEDEEYFDLVLLTEDQDSSFRIAGEQVPGSTKSGHAMNLWRRKSVFTFSDGYSSKSTGSEEYLCTIEDLRIEQNALGEGRCVVTLRVVR